MRDGLYFYKKTLYSSNCKQNTKKTVGINVRQLTGGILWSTSGMHPSCNRHNFSTGNPRLFPGLHRTQSNL